MTSRGFSRELGSDRIVGNGEQIFVYTGAAMPDWQVRKYRRIAVVWNGRSYFVAQKETVDRGMTRFVLEPWPESLNDIPGKTIHYDEDYVRTRDRARSEGRRREIESHFLRPFKPLIGFLPSRTKIRIDARWGISAKSATFFSLWAELFGFFAIGAANMINVYAHVHDAALLTPGQVACLIPLQAFLLLDLAVRYGKYLSAAEAQYGFGEWICRRRNRPRP